MGPNLRNQEHQSPGRQSTPSPEPPLLDIYGDEKFVRGMHSHVAASRGCSNSLQNPHYGHHFSQASGPGAAGNLWANIRERISISKPKVGKSRCDSGESTGKSSSTSSDLVVSGNFSNLYTSFNEQSSQTRENKSRSRLDNLLPASMDVRRADNYVTPRKELTSCGGIHGTFVFKVLVIGDPSVGKTSMVHRYVHDHFESDYKATLGVDFALKVVRWSDNVTMKLQMWDIAGQERFTSMTRVYYKDAHACVIMFDLTQRGSFLNALKWKRDLDQKCSLPDGNPVPCILLANKCDLENREVDQTEIEGFCQKQEFIGWTEVSVKEGLMVEESMRFLLDDMIARYAERNPGVTDSQALDMDRRSNVYLKASTEMGIRKTCGC